jgi:putative hydrolase of the HAD superfamily
MVALDIGGVLMAIDPDACPRMLARWIERDPAQVADALERSGLYHRHGTGELGDAAMCQAVRELLGAPGLGDGQIRAAWSASLGPPDPVLVPLAVRLAAGNRLILASNTNAWHAAETRIRLAAAGLSPHTPAVLSHLIGARKPDAAFFTRLRQEAGPISVFVDDRADNCAAARAAGIHAHRHSDSRQSAGILERLAGAWEAGEER